MHKRVRDAFGFGKQENLHVAQMIKEEYRSIRPAPGYPACPDHTEKATLWRVLDASKHTGLSLTESYVMSPSSSVSGFYFMHPDATYFRVGNIAKDQVEQYAARKGMTVSDVERWLANNIA